MDKITKQQKTKLLNLTEKGDSIEKLVAKFSVEVKNKKDMVE